MQVRYKELQKKNVLADACSQWLLIASVRYFKMQDNYDNVLAQYNAYNAQVESAQSVYRDAQRNRQRGKCRGIHQQQISEPRKDFRFFLISTVR